MSAIVAGLEHLPTPLVGLRLSQSSEAQSERVRSRYEASLTFALCRQRREWRCSNQRFADGGSFPTGVDALREELRC